MDKRQQKILQLLHGYGCITIKEISEYCKVSLNTTRSDITQLEKQGLVLKLHGSVLLNKKEDIGSPLEMSLRHNNKIFEKKKIGQLVMEHIPKDKELSIFFDSSTTSLEVAKNIVHHPMRITVITNFVNIAQIISEESRHSVIFCGGQWLNYENCTVGEYVINNINNYYVDYAILGCTAIDIKTGVYNGSFDTVKIKQQMLKNARQTWVVCDNEKFDKTDLISMFSVNEVSTIITNRIPPKHWIEYCQDSIQLIYE